MRRSTEPADFRFAILSLSLALLATALPLRAEDAEPAPSAPPAPPPYSVPFTLRPVFAVNVVRFDSAIASYQNSAGATGGLVTASVLTFSKKVTPDWSLLARSALITNAPPTGAATASPNFSNPLIGTTYSIALPSSFRLGLFGAVALSVGTGGGNTPDAAHASANAAAILGRSAMDNALFAVNYSTAIVGAGLAYISNGLTLQAEATVLHLMRARGETVDVDPARTNFTTGFLAGYEFVPSWIVETELRYQRWLNNPTVFAAAAPATQNLSFAIGPRFTFKSGGLTMRPAISYAQGLVGPIAGPGFSSGTNSDRIVHLDFPIFF